jgi:Core-2/I-Branching enzyme
MRYAYIISAYKNLEQVTRLVRRLHSDRTSFFVHVDKKTDKRDYEALIDSLRDVPSVRFLARHACHWGGFGHVKATLKGIEALLREGGPFDYAILLTGQDYPIKSNEYIDRFFQTHAPSSFMGFSALPSDSWSPRGGLDRIEKLHVRLYGRHLEIPLKRRFPSGLRPFGGGAYWCVSRDCIEYVAAFVERRPEVVSFFRNVDIPDEIFFHTILLNSELRATIVNDNLRYIDWTRGLRPAILEVRDFEALRGSPKLFARKFDVHQDEAILDLIDRHLLRPGSPAAVAETS